MRRRNCVAGEIGQFASHLSWHFSSIFPSSQYRFCISEASWFENVTVPMPPVAAASYSAHFVAFYSGVLGFGGLSRPSHLWPCCHDCCNGRLTSPNTLLLVGIAMRHKALAQMSTNELPRRQKAKISESFHQDIETSHRCPPNHPPSPCTVLGSESA